MEHDGKQRVNARDLHKALGVGRDFSNWIKGRIEEYGFVEGKDFSPDFGKSDLNSIVPGSGDYSESQNGIVAKSGDYSGKVGNPNFISKDYLISVSMAKELAIVENNEAGRKIRLYLIQIEESWNTPEMVVERARRILQAQREQERREREAQARAAVRAMQVYAGTTYTTLEVAREIGLCQSEFERWLRENRYYSDYSEEGLTVAPSRLNYFVIMGYVNRYGRARRILRVTVTGREYFKRLFEKFHLLIDTFTVPFIVEREGGLFVE
jgi:phage anti-repressor protein